MRREPFGLPSLPDICITYICMKSLEENLYYGGNGLSFQWVTQTYNVRGALNEFNRVCQ